MMVLNLGQVVALRSNPEQKMTVNKLIDSFHVGCVWFQENGTLCYSEFSNGSLMLIVESKDGMSEQVLLG
jgi:hypothetical protein